MKIFQKKIVDNIFLISTLSILFAFPSVLLAESEPAVVKNIEDPNATESIEITGQCEDDSTITIYNKTIPSGNRIIFCDKGEFKSILSLPRGGIMDQNISIFQKNKNGLESKQLPVTVTLNAVQERVLLSDYTFTRALKVFDVGTDVKMLQKMLNTAGYPISKTGLGSLDNETNEFGDGTRRALRKFQLDKGTQKVSDTATLAILKRLKTFVKKAGK